MAKCKCGDPVNYKMTFSGWQGDKTGLVVLNRLPKSPLKTFAVDVVNGDVEVKWPDLENGADYFGGAKAYLDDLPGAWLSKWNTQDYDFDVIVETTQTCSGPVQVEREPDKGVTTVSPQIPIVLYARNRGGLHLFLPAAVPKAISPKPRHIISDMGRFDLEFKNGEVVMTVAIELFPQSPKLPGNLFQIFKDTVEAFWNGPNGFRNSALHRVACVRKDACDCLIAYDATNNLTSGGCCKHPVRLEIEQGYRHAQAFNVHKEGFIGRTMGGAYAMGPGNGPGRISYPDSQNTWAHEVGHCIGFPDQYLGGHLWDAHPAGKFPLKRNSIMGAFQTKADKDFLEHAEKYMGADFTSMDDR